MAILTHSGRAAIAASIKSQELHMAWGSGDAAWDTTPVPEPVTATSLLAEIGRRGVPSATITIPVVGSIAIGIWLVESVVTDIQDPDLRDPAGETRNYSEPGAARLKVRVFKDT